MEAKRNFKSLWTVNKIMIQPQTYLTVADNTGAKQLMCIRVLGNNRKYANVGDVIIGDIVIYYVFLK